MNRATLVLLGVGLIVLTGYGAYTLRGDMTPPTTATLDERKASGPPPSVICWGYVDGERGITDLHPVQLGQITWVISDFENHRFVDVKKGDKLLELDSTLAKLKVDEAAADVRAAEEQLKQSKSLPQVYAEKKNQQRSAVAAIAAKREQVVQENKSKVELYGPDTPVGKSMRATLEESLKQLDELKKVEESKLKEIELMDAEKEISRAASDLAAKKARKLQAEYVYSQFVLLAPDDGSVLRVNVRQGEVLGPNPRQPAIMFLPAGQRIIRAEVLQEWGAYVAPGQDAVIEDDTYRRTTWKAKVERVSDWYLPTRSPVIEPFKFNDVRTLECVLTLVETDTQKEKPLRVGQRVRAKINTSK